MYITDKISLNSKRVYTDEGFLSVPAKIARTGIQDYLAIELGITDRDPKTIIRVYRPPEEVFSSDSMQSFANKPVTNNHPNELVDSTNWKDYSVGSSGDNVKKEGDFLTTKILVTDINAIKLVESGKVELSNGYRADIEMNPGITRSGDQYDAIQKNIVGNHIAIVDQARAGKDCKIADKKLGDKTNMAKITIDGVDFEVSDQASQAVKKLQESLKDAEKEVKEKKDELEEKEDELEEEKKDKKKVKDTMQAKLDDSKSRILDSSEVDKLVTQRIKFIDTVKKVNSDYSWEGKEETTIKKEIVKDKFPNLDIEKLSTDYIDARFDMILESLDNNSQHDLENSIRDSLLPDRKKKDTRTPSQKARDKFIKDAKNAWKKSEDKK